MNWRKRPYIVIDIGCLECRNGSEYLGAYRTEDEAKKAHPDAKNAKDIRTWHGEGIVVIFHAV